MSTKRSPGKQDRTRNGDIPLMLNTNNRKFKNLIRDNVRENITENIRETVREEVKKIIDQIDFKDSDGTNHVVILNNLNEELTLREKEVMHLLLKNYSNRQISIELGRKIETIKVHVKNIIKKSGCKSRWEARDLYLKLHPEAKNEDKEK